MKIVDKRLRETADVINKKFAKVNEENRGEVSGEILSHLRNFCETFMYKVYDEENDADIYQTQDNLTPVKFLVSIWSDIPRIFTPFFTASRT